MCNRPSYKWTMLYLTSGLWTGIEFIPAFCPSKQHCSERPTSTSLHTFKYIGKRWYTCTHIHVHTPTKLGSQEIQPSYISTNKISCLFQHRLTNSMYYLGKLFLLWWKLNVFYIRKSCLYLFNCSWSLPIFLLTTRLFLSYLS